MARKKRRTEKRSVDIAPVSPQLSGGRDAWLLPLFGVLILVLSWLAVLGGFSDGTLDLRHMFWMDTHRPWLTFRDAFLADSYPVSGWVFSNAGATFFFPDFAILWALFAAGIEMWLAAHLAALAQVALSAAGWMKVCDLLHGRSANRRIAVWTLHALAFLLVAWRGADVLGIHLLTLFHYGAWSVLPWLLWLSLFALENKPRKNRAALVGISLLLAAAYVGSPLIFVWFAAPAAAAGIMLSWRDSQFPRRNLWELLAALAAGTALGIAVPTEGGVGFNWFAANEIWAEILRSMGANNPLELAVWVLFAAIALWRLLVALRPPTSGMGIMHDLFGVPPGRGHLFAAVFVPASAAASLCAVLAAGRGQIHPLLGTEIESRYVIPFLYYPLFIGWALLPWKIPIPKFVPLVASLVLLGLAIPKALSIETEKINPYESPFHQCFVDNSRRFGWTAGIGPIEFAYSLASNPRAGLDAVPVAQKGPAFSKDGKVYPALYPMNDTWGLLHNNRHWWRGEFQFVVVNHFKGRLFWQAPREQDNGCEAASGNCPIAPRHSDMISEDAARFNFGEPAEVIDCAGIGLFHYDPPIRLDPPDNMRGWIIRPANSVE